MKLRHKLLLLFGAPILFQIGAAAFLAHSQSQVDQLARREMNAKKVVALCLHIQGVLGQSFMLMSTERFTADTDSREKKKLLMEAIARDLTNLRQLVESQPTASDALVVVDEYQKDCRQLLSRWQELSDAIHTKRGKFYFSQFLTQSECAESMVASLHAVHKDSEKLLGIYEPISQEFHPQAIQARQQLGFAVLGTIIAGVLLVAILAFNLNRNTLQRLDTLMQNMNSFAKGSSNIQKLEGDDELSTLNQAFAKIAEERNRLEEIRKAMRAMVSHDIRSPLTSMVLRVEMMMERNKGGIIAEDLETELKYFDAELLRLNRLANVLLDIEKIEDGNLEVELMDHPCEGIVFDSINAVDGQAKWKKIQLSSSVPPDLLMLVDRDRITQVLVNFLSNAVKFAPKNSTIDINVSVIADGRVRIEVLDRGSGVPDSKADKLFSKFTQLDQPSEVKKEGSGLGLYICKMLVEAQHGRIGYTPREGGGSCFWFETLPATTAVMSAV